MKDDEASSAWDAMWPILVEDAKQAIEDAERLGTPASRRTAFRTLFSCLEGAIWLQKLVPLVVAVREPGKYSPAELALLREETYGLDQDGSPQELKRFLRLEDNLLFTVRMVAKLEGLEPEIDRTSDGWRALKESTRVRNRVTHPRTAIDLDVSVAEFSRLRTAYAWSVGILQKALARAYLKAHDDFTALQATIKELKTGSQG